MTDEPRLSAQQLIERLQPALSPWARVRAVTALVVGLAGAAFVAALWWTEPGPLPSRTQWAFALFTVFCLAWACYGTWLLSRRVPLFAAEHVVAAWLGLAAAIGTTALVVTVAVQRGAHPVGVPAIGVLVVALPAVLLVRARARRAALLRRKRELAGGDQR
jgi:hypothetical protein